jgi:hypothetical protein
VVVPDSVHAAVTACARLLESGSPTAAGQAALFSFHEAADFAADVEELSRKVEYLQLVAAAAVDRTRSQSTATVAASAPAGWLTGWHTNSPIAQAPAEGSPGITGAPPAAACAPSPVPAPADDGYRTTTEYLRARLRIGASEARRRLALAATVLPRTGITGHQVPPEHAELARTVAAGDIGSRAATIITLALDSVRRYAPADTTARMEHALTRTAAENDTDFLARIARRWCEAIDQDGAEPTDKELSHRQGAFLRPTRDGGLHHLEIFATTDQYEHLLTVMNSATNPRSTGAPSDSTGNTDGATGDAGGNDSGGPGGDGGGAGHVPARPADGDIGGGADADGDGDTEGGADADLDRRTRPQKLLDGLVGACKAALTTGTLPAAGGLRPQVMVTIDYRDLLDRLEHATAQGPSYRPQGAGPWDGTDSASGSATGSYGKGTGPASKETPGISGTHGIPGTPGTPGIPGIPGTGSFMFTGPVTAATVRKIACDADIIPVLLGSEGRILDVGRSTRIFPPHIRKALTARDQGCAFPNCTIPAPWCEAHHITYWSDGGSTSTENGTLLCSHHHHLIHKEQWSVQVETGVPWFTPPPHIDPRRKPRRNQHFRS